MLMQHNSCLYSQHIKGVHDNVADALSRLHHYSPEKLESLIFSSFPQQVPASFHIAPLPPEISLWVISWLQKIKELKELKRERKIKNTELGPGGVSTARLSRTSTTLSSETYQKSSGPICLEPLQLPYADDSFQSQTRDLWEQAQWKRPWQNWLRSLGQMWGTTPPMVTSRAESI